MVLQAGVATRNRHVAVWDGKAWQGYLSRLLLIFSPDHCCSQTPLQPSVWRKPSAELYIGWSSNALWMKPPAISWHYSQLWNYDEDSSFDPKTIVRSIQVLCQDQIVTIPDTNAVRRTAHAEVIISILPSLETETLRSKAMWIWCLPSHPWFLLGNP